MNISEFERKKPRKTYESIQKLINKYRRLISNIEIMDDEDCIKVEMAADFAKELEEIKRIFKKGE
jgi:hypothetical protein|tara:strand:+ start:691 stop:885 length:195 start_codon:yes stop_codon:yes gene_type:complete